MKNNNSLPDLKIEYNDLKVRLLAVFLASYIVTEYGGNEPLLPRLLTIEFYIEFGTTFLITFLLVTYIYRITVYLDKRYPWSLKLLQRIFFQLALGVVAPTVGAFLFAAAYFRYYGVNILTTNYHLYALPFIASLITLFNGYYYVRYLLVERSHYKRIQERVREIVEPQVKNDQMQDKVVKGEAKPEAPIITERTVAPLVAENSGKAIFIVNTPLRSIPIRMQDICSFYRANGYYYARTEGQSVNEAYVIPQTLKEIEEQVDSNQFFRINRRMIVSFESCESFRSGNGKTLELVINPPHVDIENGMKELPFVTVSEDRSPAFKAWVDR